MIREIVAISVTFHSDVATFEPLLKCLLAQASVSLWWTIRREMRPIVGYTTCGAEPSWFAMGFGRFFERQWVENQRIITVGFPWVSNLRLANRLRLVGRWRGAWPFLSSLIILTKAIGRIFRVLKTA